MSVKYAHTNIIANDWELLSKFYINVFECEPVPPKRDQSGDWLEKATGVKNAALQGNHLRLPGYGNNGPTLEIYSYSEMLEKPSSESNRKGFGHIAFEVDDVSQKMHEVLEFGGKELGEVVVKEVPGAGIITFTYALDPENNIVEIQSWKKC